MISPAKIQELQKITAKNVLAPIHIVYDSNNKEIGYAMSYVKKTHPLCKLFTKNFKKQNGIDHNAISALVKEIQLTVASIHQDGCLIVDMNEMNFLVSSSFKTPIFIDVDSYQTKSFPATAIMDSIRDRMVKNNNFTEMSDWYSFAIIAFQLYVGVHPYKGKHPEYKPNQWLQRMDDGISVLDPASTIPKVCNPISVIPPRHLAWMENIFANKDRSIPPLPDTTGPVNILFTPTIVKGTKSFIVDKVHECQEDIISVFDQMGIKYYLTKSSIYKDEAVVSSNLSSNNKVMLCEYSNTAPIYAALKDEDLNFCNLNGTVIEAIKATDAMYRNGRIYHMYNGSLYANEISIINNKTTRRCKKVSNVSEIASQMFDGVIYQDLLGKPHLTIPYSAKACVTRKIPELEKYRIVDMKMERNVCIIVASKKGVYDRFVLIFDDKFASYSVRVDKDVSSYDVSFTVLPNGMCCLANSDSEVELFVNHGKVAKYDNGPFDSSMKLFNGSSSVYFIDGNCVYTVKTK
jgi:hypothetical protein